ncbi:biopolymer transporter ExbD [bacterium]|nr:biopolymer transporter ExbD [bacterium]
MAEIVSQKSRGKSKRRIKRVGIRLDMTPMVDVAFLLLTFFMLTTAFRLPQTLEISIPEAEGEKSEIRISEESILQIRVTKENVIFWNIGRTIPQKVDQNALKDLFVQQSDRFIQAATEGLTIKEKYKLVVLIKISRQSKYANMIDIVDELNLAIHLLNEKYRLNSPSEKLTPRFSFATFTDTDVEAIRLANPL